MIIHHNVGYNTALCTLTLSPFFRRPLRKNHGDGRERLAGLRSRYRASGSKPIAGRSTEWTTSAPTRRVLRMRRMGWATNCLAG